MKHIRLDGKSQHNEDVRCPFKLYYKFFYNKKSFWRQTLHSIAMFWLLENLLEMYFLPLGMWLNA